MVNSNNLFLLVIVHYFVHEFDRLNILQLDYRLVADVTLYKRSKILTSFHNSNYKKDQIN